MVTLVAHIIQACKTKAEQYYQNGDIAMPATLKLDKIVVHESRDGGPGDNSEWHLDIDVKNSQGFHKHIDFDQDGVNSTDKDGDDQTFLFNINIGQFDRDQFLDSTISANGFEDDDTSANDPLPSAFRELNASEYHDGSFTMHAERGDFSYTLHWTVDVAPFG